ncbi:MAG: sensor domain-containing diguanylate cyclase [Pseudomonadota bacterium]
MTALATLYPHSRRAGYSRALIALAGLGLAQIAFLAYAFLAQVSHNILLLESIGIVILTLICLSFVSKEDERAEQAEVIAESQLSHLADFATDLFWETDLEGHVATAGGRLMKTISPDLNQVVGQHYLDIVKLDDGEMARMLAALQGVQPYSDILSVFHDPNGTRYYISLSATPRYDQKGNVMGYLGVGTNVTDRIETQRRLQHMAEHDMLTGLANRYAFSARIDEDLMRCAEDENIAMLAIDLDNFKAINDTYGHQAGDALLNLTAKRIRQTIRSEDWAARLGGDEFVVVSRDITNPMDACLVAARLVKVLSKPYRIGGIELVAPASIGISCAPLHAGNAEDLMKCADLALYEAKDDGRGCYRLFTDSEPGATNLQ